MIQRLWRLVLMFVGVSLAFAPATEAQRSGFIIGFGLGIGEDLYSSTSVRSQTEVALDFHIGGVIGDSFELYYVIKDPAWDGPSLHVEGIGFGYLLSPRFSINGGIGVTRGRAFSAGGRYLLSESGRWGLGFDIVYKRLPDVRLPDDFQALGAQFTIQVLSH